MVLVIRNNYIQMHPEGSENKIDRIIRKMNGLSISVEEDGNILRNLIKIIRRSIYKNTTNNEVNRDEIRIIDNIVIDKDSLQIIGVKLHNIIRTFEPTIENYKNIVVTINDSLSEVSKYINDLLVLDSLMIED